MRLLKCDRCGKVADENTRDEFLFETRGGCDFCPDCLEAYYLFSDKMEKVYKEAFKAWIGK